MRNVPNLRIEHYRRVHPVLGDSDAGENWGYFGVRTLRIIATDGIDPEADGWEHVSVSTQSRTPTWGEMDEVKRLFWADTETVMQFHPRDDQRVNYHPYALHLWKRLGVEVELPPTRLVGPMTKPPTDAQRYIDDMLNFECNTAKDRHL